MVSSPKLGAGGSQNRLVRRLPPPSDMAVQPQCVAGTGRWELVLQARSGGICWPELAVPGCPWLWAKLGRRRQKWALVERTLQNSLGGQGQAAGDPAKCSWLLGSCLWPLTQLSHLCLSQPLSTCAFCCGPGLPLPGRMGPPGPSTLENDLPTHSEGSVVPGSPLPNARPYSLLFI